MIHVVFNKHFDIIPSSPEDDVSELHRKLGTNKNPCLAESYLILKKNTLNE